MGGVPISADRECYKRNCCSSVVVIRVTVNLSPDFLILQRVVFWCELNSRVQANTANAQSKCKERFETVSGCNKNLKLEQLLNVINVFLTVSKLTKGEAVWGGTTQNPIHAQFWKQN